MAFPLAGLGLLGLLVGSFLTVVVGRLAGRETVIRGRSRCVHCGRTLSWFELLPVLSFLFQGGQCRSCRKPIPRLYPAIELTTALLFLGVGWAILQGALPLPALLAGRTPGSAETAAAFLYYAFFATGAVAISAYDFQYRLIPSQLVWPVAVVGFGEKALGAAWSGESALFFQAAIVAAAIFFGFLAIWFFSGGKAMGRGDANVALAISGYLGPAAGLAGLLFAFWIGALGGIVLVAAGRLGWKSEIPFAPILFLGAFAALFASESLRGLYAVAGPW